MRFSIRQLPKIVSLLNVVVAQLGLVIMRWFRQHVNCPCIYRYFISFYTSSPDSTKMGNRL